MIQELSLQSFFHAFALLSVAHHTPKNRNRMPCFGHMWSIRYRSTMRHKLANRMAQQARILTITNIKYRWKPPAASLDIENENIQLRHENSTATSRNNFSASTVLNDCAHFLHHSKFDTTEISTLVLFLLNVSRYFAIYPVLHPIVWQLHTSDSWLFLLTSCS